MISVLIPTYQYDTFPLIKEIHKQLLKTDVTFEIICIDDCSDKSAKNNNEAITALDHCIYHKLDTNIGRSKIRNLLASKANYEWLLFLDADVFPKSPYFIKTYLKSISELKCVVCGGVNYHNEKPTKDRLLRWVYGKKHEEVSITKRQSDPYHHFFSANFFIHKSIFNKIKFNEEIRNYGHEDTLFSLCLRNENVLLKHIDNSVYHLGIETNEIFLTKAKESVLNAYYLYQNNLFKKNDLKLVDAFLTLKSLRLSNIFAYFFKKTHKLMESNLTSENPSILVFQIYKLGYLCANSR